MLNFMVTLVMQTVVNLFASVSGAIYSLVESHRHVRICSKCMILLYTIRPNQTKKH